MRKINYGQILNHEEILETNQSLTPLGKVKKLGKEPKRIDGSLMWKTLFAINESPYFGMFRAGQMGIPIEECSRHLQEINVPIRTKDVQAWKDGHWRWQLYNKKSVLNPILKPGAKSVPVLEMKLSEFDQWPEGWSGTERRWFPCSNDNFPLQKWGYGNGVTPCLYDRESAQAISPCGWVGQNLYAQPFIVIDIDGEGHGEPDQQVVDFGNQYRNITESWSHPSKPNSFHLYFNTNYQIPISHYGFAKLDLMGNQKNAAVYTKNKLSNGIPRETLTEEIWKDLQGYVLERRRQRDNQ